MSIFQSTYGGGVFSEIPPCGGGTQYTLSFARAAHLYYGTAPIQDARGELTLSFIDLGTMTLEMQPTDREILREKHGIVRRIMWLGFSITNVLDLHELDRCIFNGDHLEVVNVAPWGTHVEIEFEQIGR